MNIKNTIYPLSEPPMGLIMLKEEFVETPYDRLCVCGEGKFCIYSHALKMYDWCEECSNFT